MSTPPCLLSLSALCTPRACDAHSTPRPSPSVLPSPRTLSRPRPTCPLEVAQASRSDVSTVKGFDEKPEPERDCLSAESARQKRGSGARSGTGESARAFSSGATRFQRREGGLECVTPSREMERDERSLPREREDVANAGTHLARDLRGPASPQRPFRPHKMAQLSPHVPGSRRHAPSS